MKRFHLKKNSANKTTSPSRITNETVAEHRERILAGGRRFKYPMQYARHRLVINTILVTIAALIVIVTAGWWELYSAQTTSSFFYRVTRVLPLPIASVDGQLVRYSDYLMYYNSSVHYLQQSEQVNLSSPDGKRQLEYIKQQSMDNVIEDAYAVKLAAGLHITVSDAMVDQVINADRNTVNGVISQATYDASALDILGWTPDEYRQDTRSKLILHKVEYAVDTIALQKEQKAAMLLAQPNASLTAVATELGGQGAEKVLTGASGFVPRTNQDGGLSTAAAKLQKGQISGAIETTTGDGYYFVQLVDENDTQVSYAYLKIPLTMFNQQLANLKSQGKVHEYITIPNIR